MTDRNKQLHEESNADQNEYPDVLTDDQQAQQDVDTEIIEVEARSADTIKKLKAQLNDVKEERRVALEAEQRAKADFLNTKKRLEEEMRLKVSRERESILLDLLPICDSFQMAMQNAEQWEKVDAIWRSGVEGIYSQLRSVLESYNVQQVESLGTNFDPSLHEAVDEVAASETHEHNTITRVVQSGYQITDTKGNTRVLRPARVVVANKEKSG